MLLEIFNLTKVQKWWIFPHHNIKSLNFCKKCGLFDLSQLKKNHKNDYLLFSNALLKFKFSIRIIVYSSAKAANICSVKNSLKEKCSKIKIDFFFKTANVCVFMYFYIFKCTKNHKFFLCNQNIVKTARNIMY